MSSTLTVTIMITGFGDSFLIEGVNPSNIDVTSIDSLEVAHINGLDRGGLIALDIARQLEYIGESDTDTLRSRMIEGINK